MHERTHNIENGLTIIFEFGIQIILDQQLSSSKSYGDSDTFRNMRNMKVDSFEIKMWNSTIMTSMHLLRFGWTLTKIKIAIVDY